MAKRSFYVNCSSYTVNAFRVQVENGLENIFFLLFSLVSIHYALRFTKSGYAVIQVKHRRYIELKLSVYFKLLRAAFFSVLQLLAYL